MIYLAKIFLFVILAFIPYMCIRYTKCQIALSDRTHLCIQKKISIVFSLICALLFGWYSTICSGNLYGYDRENYAYRFSIAWVDNWSVGLRTIGRFLRNYTDDPNILFFSVTFLCVFVTLLAYKISENGSKETLLFWAFGLSIVYSFYLLKQAPAIALGIISIVFFLKQKYFSSAIFLILSVLFHESALILIPLYIAMSISKSTWSRWIIYLLIAVCVLFFTPISRMTIRLFEIIYPQVSEQISGYLDETGAISSSLNIATAFKGFPYYLITFYGFINRRGLKNEIQCYDQYLMMSICSSGLYLLSSYMYWMWRFAAYCFFPMCIFASELYRKKKNRRSAQLFFWGLLTSLAFFTLRYLFQIYFNHGGF